ncbi:MAG: HAD-IA family hydrolase, partial [Hyphomicrobiaceae bacterium]
SLSPAIQRLLPTMRGAFIDEVADSYKQAFADLRRRPEHHEPLFPLAGEALAALAAEPDTLLGIATGKSRRGVDAVIEREGFHGLFATIQTADDNPSKPDPEMLLRAMRETGARSRDTVMIGDTTFDMEMARAAGTRALGVCWGYHPPELLVRAGAHDMIDGYEHLPAALARLLPAREATP